MLDLNNNNFHLLPEWETQSGVMLTWPHAKTIWAETLTTIDQVFAEITKEISKREKVLISCYDATHKQHIEKLLAEIAINRQQISIYFAPCDDVWVRDHGPLSVKNNENKIILLDFIFNGWGEKYPFMQDNQISRMLHSQKAFGANFMYSLDLVLEGGAIEVDGEGTLLTTTSCLLSKTRNPKLSKEVISERLSELFGLKKILWLEHGHLAGDDTDGHIDTLARFVNPDTICYITCDDETDEHYPALKAMEKQLQTFTNYQNKAYNLIPLPWPKARYAEFDQRRLPATYANFLIINEAVLVPTYADANDKKALEILAQCFPNREIIGINCLPVIQWYGSLHCMTMQLPLGVL